MSEAGHKILDDNTWVGSHEYILLISLSPSPSLSPLSLLIPPSLPPSSLFSFDLDVLIATKHQEELRRLGVTSEAILSHVGFPNLDNHLSDMLYTNYKSALPRILPHLESLLGSSQRQLAEVNKMSVRSIRTQMSILLFITCFPFSSPSPSPSPPFFFFFFEKNLDLASEAVVKCVEELLDGYVSKTTKRYGKLLREDVNISEERAKEVKGTCLFYFILFYFILYYIILYYIILYYIILYYIILYYIILLS